MKRQWGLPQDYMPPSASVFRGNIITDCREVTARGEHAIDGHRVVHRFAVPVRKRSCVVDREPSLRVALLERVLGTGSELVLRQHVVDSAAFRAVEISGRLMRSENSVSH